MSEPLQYIPPHKICNAPVSIEEIVNKAIPLSFEGVKCDALRSTLTQKALRRREQLTKDILTLLETKSNAGSNVRHGVGRSEAY